MTIFGAELELMGAPEDVAGKTNSFLELLIDSSWEEIEIPEAEGPNVKLELNIELLENLNGDSIDCSNELLFELLFIMILPPLNT